MTAATATLLDRIDQAIREMQAVRDELANTLSNSEGILCGTENLADDLSPEHLVDTTSAASRMGFPRDTVAKWAREEGIGVKRGGRWLVSIPRLRRRINGG